MRYLRLLTGFGMLVFFTSITLIEFKSDIWSYFSVVDSFEWFWMGSLHKNIHLMLEC